MSDDRVSAALELILEEMTAVEEQLRAENQAAFQQREFDLAKSLADAAERLVAFQTKLELLAFEWARGIDAETRERVRVEPCILDCICAQRPENAITGQTARREGGSASNGCGYLCRCHRGVGARCGAAPTANCEQPTAGEHRARW